MKRPRTLEEYQNCCAEQSAVLLYKYMKLLDPIFGLSGLLLRVCRFPSHLQRYLNSLVDLSEALPEHSLRPDPYVSSFYTDSEMQRGQLDKAGLDHITLLGAGLLSKDHDVVSKALEAMAHKGDATLTTKIVAVLQYNFGDQ